MMLEQIRRSVRDAGPSGACLDLTYKVLNRLTTFMALTMVSLVPEGVDRSYLTGHAGYVHRFLRGSELNTFSRDPANDLPQDFVSGALAKGDRCYAILDGDVLAAYGWYARGKTPITEELTLRFDPEWVYMYKGFTRPEYRGQRLHAIGMAKAMMEYAGEGLRGIVSFVEANNFASLKSCYRLGYAQVGTIYALRLGRHFFVHVTAGCPALGLDLEPRVRVADAPSAPRGSRRSAG